MIQIRILLVISFIFLWCMKSYGQQNDRPNLSWENYRELAADEALFLNDTLKLNGDQKSAITELFIRLYSEMLALNESGAGYETRVTTIKKMAETQENRYKKIFSKEQYQKYQIMINWRKQKEYKIH